MYYTKLLSRCCIALFGCLIGNNIAAQEITSVSAWNRIIQIENDEQLPVAEKLLACERLKQTLDDNKLPVDSVYARLLHRIGALHFQFNNVNATEQAIDYTNKAANINNSGGRNCSPYFAVNSYANLAIFYRAIKLYKKAYSYYDSAIVTNDGKKLFNPVAITCHVGKVLMSLQAGDYQKCIEDCTKGIFIAGKSGRIDVLTTLFNQRAQSYLYLKKINLALTDVDSARKYALMLKEDYELATEAKTRALLQAELYKDDEAIASFAKALKYRMATGDLAQIADDYTDLGNFLLERKQYGKAMNAYNNTVQYARNADDVERLCKGYTNLGELFFLKGSDADYRESEKYYQKALEVFGIHEKSILKNPALQKLSTIGNADLIFVILGNKTELLLQLYKTSGQKEYLEACINTGLLMDSAITQVRHEQTGENSKLYWRNNTRAFFVNILEACYLANNRELGFHFMEKSRAVLLNDKLNETAASIRLPEAENLEEQHYKLRLIEARTLLNSTDIYHENYNSNLLAFLQIKGEFEQYAKTLEQKYPSYYKYKYADDIPTLQNLQQKLLENKETFIHYFIEDTVVYILVINNSEVKMLRRGEQRFNAEDLNLLLDFCSDKQRLNNSYTIFASLSNKLYHSLFADLNVSPGRVIISQDNMLIPFEVLTKDEKGKEFLLYDYTFSYVYSASFLLKKMTHRSAKADFVGFAPVSFKAYLKLPELKNAAFALQKSAAHYSNMILLDNSKATRNSFLSQMADYNIVSVFSHAFADTAGNEPVLFMQDSVINLSELQLMSIPATQLVMLSACQTNVGRNETGEGIYSLARGFASIGIPAVSATLWKADENAIYQISEEFNACLAQGFYKDDALKQAKLKFIDGNSNERLLPYYWANMIIIGKTDPVDFLPVSSTSKIFWWIAALTLIGSAFTIKYYLNTKNENKHEKRRY